MNLYKNSCHDSLLTFKYLVKSKNKKNKKITLPPCRIELQTFSLQD